MEDPNDRAIESRLREAAPECWKSLWAAADELLAPESGLHSEWIFIAGQTPYLRYSDEMNALLRALADAAVLVDFPWQRWDGLRRYECGHGLAEAPVAESVRVLSVMAASERFITGTAAHLLEDGTLAAALQRLRTWQDEHSAAAPGAADRRRSWRRFLGRS